MATYKLDGSEIIGLKSQIKRYAVENSLQNQEEQIKQYVFDTIDTIVNDEKFGVNFIPEIDGKRIIQTTLPIQEAITKGKESDEYKTILAAYKIINQYVQRKIEKISPALNQHDYYKTNKKPTLDELDMFT